MTDTAIRPVAIRQSAQIRALVERTLAIIILGLVGVWLIANVIKSPQQTFSSAVQGLNNGALYALIALGYTLVYGIIELINFAHGDLFMLGTLFAAFITTSVFGVLSN